MDWLRGGARGYPEGMNHLDIDTVLGWRGRDVRDPDGEKIGTLGDVFLDRDTQRPAWGGVRTGLFGRRESFVPLDRIEAGQDDDLVVPFTKEQVKDAPQIDPEVALTAAEEERLWTHYGQDYAAPSGDAGDDAAGPRDGDGSGAGDGAMTRSEEEVRVHEGTMEPAERVRLRKVLVTEHEKRTGPVRQEVVQLETEPPPEGEIVEVTDVDEEQR